MGHTGYSQCALLFLPKFTRYSQCVYQNWPVVACAFLPKRTGHSQCVYQNGLVIISARINTPVIVSVFNCFYQNTPVIISVLQALRDLYCVLSSRYLKLYCYVGISTKWRIEVRTKNSLPPNIFVTPLLCQIVILLLYGYGPCFAHSCSDYSLVVPFISRSQ